MKQLSTALKRLSRQPSFIVAFLVLLVAAVTLNAATQFLKLHFKKLPVPLARRLTPSRCSWAIGSASPRTN